MSDWESESIGFLGLFAFSSESTRSIGLIRMLDSIRLLGGIRSAFSSVGSLMDTFYICRVVKIAQIVEYRVFVQLFPVFGASCCF